jgi:DNA-directed RNA polymerase subunit H (RpoH/RPB5)/predicted RNA binding protein YcfA (HicA-like mRNA interferase family)
VKKNTPFTLLQKIEIFEINLFALNTMINIDKIQSNLSTTMAKKWTTACQNIHHMMELRGFSFERQIELLFFSYVNSKKQKTIICIFPNEKLSIETLREIIQFSESKKCRQLILILQNVWSANCKKIFENLTFFSINMFYMKEFQYDLTKLHYYVPHEKIENKELLQEIKQKYKNGLPTLSKNDMIARYFDFSRGDVIRVIRNDFNVPSIAYRVVK